MALDRRTGGMMQQVEDARPGGSLAALGLRLSEWFERWFPDAFTLALIAVAVVFAASLAAGATIVQAAQWFGAGFWDLTNFTLQVAMIIVTGYAVATAPPVFRVISRLAAVPKTPRGAMGFVALFSTLSSMISWSFSLIFSALLAREVARRMTQADYRALGAAAYVGAGSVWALGLSSSAALIMASAGSLPASIKAISGVIPLQQTIGLWQSLLAAAILIVVSVVIAYYSAPDARDARSIDDMGVETTEVVKAMPRPSRPGEWMEHSPALTLLVAGMATAYLVARVSRDGWTILLDLNHFVLIFFIAGMLLHWRPRSFMQAISSSASSTGGVLVQYPMYAGMVKMMTESGLATAMAHFFVKVSTAHTLPVLVGAYSAVLGLFIPSAGGKWLIEAPYVLQSAKDLGVHSGWVVQTYNASEALANLVHPFWMLPLLGILGLKARDIVGYSMLQFVVHVPLVLLLVWLLNFTLL
jgi:short-chain fatty acids transporter